MLDNEQFHVVLLHDAMDVLTAMEATARVAGSRKRGPRHISTYRDKFILDPCLILEIPRIP